MRPHGRPRAPAHDTERRAIGRAAAAASRDTQQHAKRRPSPLGDGRFKQLIHRGSGSTDSTMLRRPSYRDRRTLPRTSRVPHCRAHRRVIGFPDPIPFVALVTPMSCAACKRIRRATGCVAPWNDDSGSGPRPSASVRGSSWTADRHWSDARVTHARRRSERTRSFGWNGKPLAHVAAISGEANTLAGRRFMFATRHVAFRSFFILLSPSSIHPTH